MDYHLPCLQCHLKFVPFLYLKLIVFYQKKSYAQVAIFLSMEKLICLDVMLAQWDLGGDARTCWPRIRLQQGDPDSNNRIARWSYYFSNYIDLSITFFLRVTYQ
jgi:hypothetical protein